VFIESAIINGQSPIVDRQHPMTETDN